MTARGLIAAGLALIGLGYLVVQFGALVLEDLAIERAAGQGAGRDAETRAWLEHLRTPDSEFDEWCAQAIALTREPHQDDLDLWERELGATS